MLMTSSQISQTWKWVDWKLGQRVLNINGQVMMVVSREMKRRWGWSGNGQSERWNIWWRWWWLMRIIALSLDRLIDSPFILSVFTWNCQDNDWRRMNYCSYEIFILYVMNIEMRYFIYMCGSLTFGLIYIFNINLKRVNIKNSAKLLIYIVYLHEVRFTIEKFISLFIM